MPVEEHIVVDDIDWGLLRDQRDSLLGLLDAPRVIDEDTAYFISGLVNLLDYMLDKAHDAGYIVLGEDKEES